MNNRLYSHLYLHSKNIFILKKFSTFANFLMEKTVNSFAISKICKKHLKKEILREGPASFTVPVYANQPPGFSVRETSTPNRFF